MDLLVLFKITILTEALPTLVTVVGPLSCMDSLVDFETRALGEQCPTLVTVVRLLSRVSLPVSS